MICGLFSLSHPSRIGVLEALPPLLQLRPSNDGWLELLLQRMVVESAVQHPGQQAVLSRMTEVLFVEALRSWIKPSIPVREVAWRNVGPLHRKGPSADS